MNEAIDWIVDNWDLLAGGAAALLTLATTITRLTPTPADDEWLAHVIGVVGRFSWLHPSGGWKAPGARPDVGSTDGDS